MFAQVVTINGKIDVGLQLKSYYEDQNNPKLTSILLPIEAWTTFVSQALPTLDNEIKEHHATHPPPATEKPTSTKPPYYSGILNHNIFTLFNFRAISIFPLFSISSSFFILNHSHNFRHIIEEIISGVMSGFHVI